MGRNINGKFIKSYYQDLVPSGTVISIITEFFFNITLADFLREIIWVRLVIINNLPPCMGRNISGQLKPIPGFRA